MEVYAQPQNRVIFGQNKLMSINASQTAMYFKYTTIIRTFLAGTTADVLRMRLQQVVDASLMTLKSFLNYHKVNIILALRKSQSFLILVFPPSDIAPDPSAWNTQLLCLVLRASNCLNVSEQDDVIYLSKIYKRYFNNRLQDPGCGTITKKGFIAKQEWFRTCASIQRIVEVVDDPELIKQVRIFICTVEMEGKSPKAKNKSQLRLESFVSELISGDKLQKHRDSNLTDEAKQIVKTEFKIRKTPKRKQRPLSADTVLNLARKNVDNTIQYSCSRPTSATRSVMSHSSRRSSVRNSKRGTIRSDKKPFIKVTVNSDKVDETKSSVAQKERVKNGSLSISEKKRTTARKRPSSAIERSTTKTSTKAGVCRRSSISLKHERLYNSESNDTSLYAVRDSSTTLSKDSSRISRPGSAKEKRPTKSILKRQMPLHVKTLKPKNENEKVSPEKYSYAPENKRNSEIKRENSMILKGIRPSSGRRQRSRRSKNTSKEAVIRKKEHDVIDTVICVPTAEPDLTDENNENQENEVKQKVTSNKSKKGDKNTKEYEETKGDKAKEKTFTCFKKLGTEGKPKSEENGDGRKRKVFDENMKKIANEVLVHQKIHEAANNTLLQDKEFVDEFFAFLNENHVTKKFLRAQSVEPRESWNLPNGTHTHFSFFLAFVFRHIHTTDIKMVSYVVEKMLLRMRCKHSADQRTRDSDSKTIHDTAGNGECLLSPEHEDRRRVYQEVSSSVDCEHRRNISRPRSASRDGRSSSSMSSRRSRSSSKRTRPDSREDKLRVYRSTSITENLCWKCIQKELALTACVHWSNRYLCDLLISEGVVYKQEHLSAAVKAGDLIALVKIVDFLKNRGVWNKSSAEVRDALFLARKLKMYKMVEFLTEENIEDERIVNNNICTPCFIA